MPRFAQPAGKALLLPGKAISAALTALAACSSPPAAEVLTALEQYHALVVQYLKALGEQAACQATCMCLGVHGEVLCRVCLLNVP